MIVSELIATLQELDPTLKVMIPGADPADPDNDSCPFEVTDVSVGFAFDHTVTLWSDVDEGTEGLE